MDLTYTPEQERLRDELRAYFATLMTPERRAALATTDGEYGSGGAYRQVVRELGRDGWLALSSPREYGGRGGSGSRPTNFPPDAAPRPVSHPSPSPDSLEPQARR